MLAGSWQARALGRSRQSSAHGSCQALPKMAEVPSVCCCSRLASRAHPPSCWVIDGRQHLRHPMPPAQARLVPVKRWYFVRQTLYPAINVGANFSATSCLNSLRCAGMGELQVCSSMCARLCARVSRAIPGAPASNTACPFTATTKCTPAQPPGSCRPSRAEKRGSF